MKKTFFSVWMLLGVTFCLLSVPPVPGNPIELPSLSYPSEIFGPDSSLRRNDNVPDSILVLRAQFSDVTFDMSATQPDSVPHDKTYFERWMYHLSSFYHDASHGKYHLTEENYTVWEHVFTLPSPMSYYGDDNERTKRIAELMKTVIEMADAEIDFSNYDSFIIFHAGAGQEADLTGNNQDALWSTFVTRKTLQAGLDPENDNYQGIQTNEKLIKEAVIVPESQWHPDNQPGDQIFSMFGVLAHLFGHQLGLPTLYDNYSGDGSSFGIGNFGIMGTGLWNAKGFVPPLPCAWSRYYLGWENDNIAEFSSDAINQSILFPTSGQNGKKLAKINISEKEYFLIENRQYNPDNSTIGGDPNFTFQLLPQGEQDYYPPPYENVPRFNFMENSYLGCEWDFFLPGPGYGEPPTPPDYIISDGSGLFIWHIDENIIEQNFSPDFEYNFVNSDASHKGVDLEEADGVQHLDASVYNLGTAFDSYRIGNNDYFGKMYYPETDTLWIPTAESYYGGIPVEIYNISASANAMTFSVRYQWQLQADNYEWENPFPAMFLDIDNDDENEIIYPMPSGKIEIWKNNESVIATFQQLQPFSFIYSYNEENGSVYFPCHAGLNETALIRVLHHDFNTQLLNLTFSGMRWAAPIVINPEKQNQAFFALNSIDGVTSEVKIFENFSEHISHSLPHPIIGNMMLKDNQLFVITKGEEYYLTTISGINYEIESTHLLRELPVEMNIAHAILIDWNQDNSPNLVVTINDSLVYGYRANGILMDGFPVDTGLYKAGIPSVADLDGNGYLDVLVGGENTFVAINHLGTVLKPSQAIPAADSLEVASGVIAIDLDGDGALEVLGNMSKNRFCVWKNTNNNDFNLSDSFTHSYLKRSRNYPQLVRENSDLYAFISADEGSLFRQYMGANITPNGWIHEYATLGRIASYDFSAPDNQYATKKIFVNEHTYVYPNPFSRTNNQSIYQGSIRPNAITIKLMLSEDANAKIKVFDIAGNKVFEVKKECFAYMQKDVEVNVQNLASGMYFVIIEVGEKTKMMKFAIEK